MDRTEREKIRQTVPSWRKFRSLFPSAAAASRVIYAIDVYFFHGYDDHTRRN